MALVLLEDFEEPDLPAHEAAGPSEDWLDGHAAGVAAAQNGASAETARCAGQIVQALSDLHLTLEAARAEILEELAPFFEAVLVQILPPLFDHALVLRGVDMLAAAAGETLDTPKALLVNPEDREALVSALSEDLRQGVDLVSDSSLGRGELVLSTDTGETAIDLSRLLDDLTELIRHFITPAPANKDRRHG